MKSLNELFYNPKTGLTKKNLMSSALKEGYTREEINNFLSNQEVYQLHKPKPTNIKFFPIIGVPGTMQTDLTFYDQYKKANRGYHILLTAIEVNSRRAYVRALKNKNQSTIIEAFKSIIEEAKDHLPIKVVGSDQGSEFLSGFVNMLKSQGIDHYYSNAGSKTEMGMVERFNRTIRGLIEKYMTAYNTNVYIDVLQDLTNNYNNTVHGVTGYKPNQVGKKELKEIAKQKTERIMEAIPSHDRYTVGQKVRRWKPKSVLEKKTGENFYRGIYTISSVQPFSYKLASENGAVLKQTFQHYDLQPISEVNVAEGKRNVNKPNIREIQKNLHKIEQELKRDGIDRENVLALPRRRSVRERKKPDRL